MAITIAAPPAEDSLAWAKAARGISLTVRHRKLVALHLARRVHGADSGIECLTGQERQILAQVATGPDLAGRFAQLVAAYTDFAAVEENVDAWRHEVDPPMSRDAAVEYVADHLVDALDSLIVVPTVVTA